MFEKILVAVDGSPQSRKAFEMACGLAAAHDAELTIVHVLGTGEVPDALVRFAEAEHLVDDRAPQPAVMAGDVSSGIAATGRSAAREHRLHEVIGERLVEEMRSGARAAGVSRVKVFMEEGDPAARILARAATGGADLIVTGSRGLSEIKGLVLGSVSHKLLHIATCPCLLVR